MAGLLLFYVTLSTLISTAISEYCYYYSSSIFSSYRYQYSKFCPFGCCGSNYYQYCCVTNGGYVAGLVIGILVLVAIIITVSCCCVRQRRYRAAQTTTVVSGVPAGNTIFSTNVTNSSAYPTVAYNANYGYPPDSGQQFSGTAPQYPMYPPYPSYPVNQGFGSNINDPSSMNGAKPQPPPSYISSPPPAYPAHE